jgi:hypothetical protein
VGEESARRRRRNRETRPTPRRTSPLSAPDPLGLPSSPHPPRIHPTSHAPERLDPALGADVRHARVSVAAELPDAVARQDGLLVLLEQRVRVLGVVQARGPMEVSPRLLLGLHVDGSAHVLAVQPHLRCRQGGGSQSRGRSGGGGRVVWLVVGRRLVSGWVYWSSGSRGRCARARGGFKVAGWPWPRTRCTPGRWRPGHRRTRRC